MLNQSAEYALRVVVHLASLPSGEVGRAAEMAIALGMPANYLSKILHQLASAGVLTSRRGRAGGFRLTRPANRTTLAAVIAPFDDIATRKVCVLGSRVCSDRTACTAHERWKPISESLRKFLKQTTVDSMAPSATVPSS